MKATKSTNLIARFLRFFFKHLYTDLSWSYDAVAWVTSVGQWRTWQRIGLDPLTPGPTLEIGIGTGHILRELAGQESSVVGMDVSPQMARIAHNRLTKATVPALITQASSFNLPFPRSTFTNVLSTFPSEYIYAFETFEEIFRVLEPGGRFVVIPGVETITGPNSSKLSLLRILDGIAAWLYSFTGEQTTINTDWRREFENKLLQLGFRAKIESITTKRAIVLRLVAVKEKA